MRACNPQDNGKPSVRGLSRVQVVCVRANDVGSVVQNEMEPGFLHVDKAAIEMGRQIKNPGTRREVGTCDVVAVHSGRCF